jgi:tRNA1(Val) A37 N6-methylase TrmN6
MNGLKSWQPNEGKRSTHIIKNMLYFCEIDKDNSALIKKMVSNIIGCKVTVNLLVGDFLSDSKQNKEFVKDGFDIIVGNPPFQDDPTIINENIICST